MSVNPFTTLFTSVACPGSNPASNRCVVAPAAGGHVTPTVEPFTVAEAGPGAPGKVQAFDSVTITSFDATLPQAFLARTRT